MLAFDDCLRQLFMADRSEVTLATQMLALRGTFVQYSKRAPDTYNFFLEQVLYIFKKACFEMF